MALIHKFKIGDGKGVLVPEAYSRFRAGQIDVAAFNQTETPKVHAIFEVFASESERDADDGEPIDKDYRAMIDLTEEEANQIRSIFYVAAKRDASQFAEARDALAARPVRAKPKLDDVEPAAEAVESKPE